MWDGVRAGIIILALAAGIPSPFAAQTPQALLDSVIVAYGGREALARVTAYEMRGTVESLVRGGRATTIRTFARPSRLRVVLHYPQRVEVRVLDGGRGWRGDQRGLVPASGPMLDAMRLQAARAALPWLLDEHRDELRTAPPLDLNGVACPGLSLDLGNGLELHAYVDPATHYVANVQTSLRTRALTAEFVTSYGEFRSVDGVVFAFREENFASGTHTGSTTFERVVVNPAVDDETFRPEGGRGFRQR